MAVGRISGPLLTENLERNGIDLSFRNTLSDTSLLKLNVTAGKVSVNRNSAATELDVTGSEWRSTELKSTTANIANFNFANNSINVLSGDIYLRAQEAIKLSNFETDNIRITDNTISTFNSNANIDLYPSGTGTIDVFNNLNITGNLHATGDITFDGDITFGDNDAQDIVKFFADVNSDIVPAANATYNLGSSSKKWSNLYSQAVQSVNQTINNFKISDVSFGLRTGNTFYVAQNGSDSNAGDHPNGAFKTLKRALDAADASTDGPVTILVYPGGYEEELPLTVPSNCTVTGIDMRNTIIRPESAYQSEDVFLLNGESTVQHLTIKDFYYDSVADTGYAFRFAPNTVITRRSPYVQNVTVITQGSTTSPTDRRGFASGDAGKGALVDGADVLSASEEASMLFHSVTFITPGVDALTMTNGVRVEWLNSFTYFANRGLYAVDGATGHLSTDGSTVKYGAEIRSIGSANVYGNYGAVADGADTLMYLIQHNFAYIGLGKFVDNDPSRAIQSQEVTELNSGKIYFQSIDHLGNFRVGDEFFIDQESGESTITVTAGELDAIGGLNVTTGGETTFFRGSYVDTGNIRFRNNEIISTENELNLQSASTIEFLTNTNFEKNLDISGNFSIGGNLLTLGNQTTDTVAFNAEFPQDVFPAITGIYSLGSVQKKWAKANLSQANISDVKIQDNFITTNISNSNLELRASGTGIVYIENNNVVIDNALTVNGITTVFDTNITGTTTQTGNNNITGNVSSTNFQTDRLFVARNVAIADFSIQQNNISITTADTDLSLKASGVGQILIPNNNTLIKNNLTAGSIDVDFINITNNVALNELTGSGDIEINDNYITTTQSNSNLELRRPTSAETVVIDDFNITTQVIASDTNITLSPTEDLIVDSTGAVKLPVGTTAQDPQLANSLRYNSEDEVIEGFGTARQTFATGVYSADRLTSLTADETSNNIRAIVGGDFTPADSTYIVTEITGDAINSTGVTVDDISMGILQNTIQSTSNLNLVTPNNTITVESLVIDNLNNITNPTTDDPIKLKGSGTGVNEGYWNFTSLPALKFPSGDTASRPTSPLVGQARHNTDTGELEVYNGTEWQTAAGEFDNISEADMEEEALIQTFIYG